MKKNITINLFGTLYAIDDDACQLLEQYLNNMRSYFGKRDGGDEIADDIEHRVAELFSEMKANGTEAISIEHVRDIIHRIGNPEQMDDETAADAADNHQQATAQEATQQQDAQPKGRRKLYRDPQDQLLGGVMSGVCKYFGGSDPLPWRILMVLLALVSFSTIGIIYLIAWALIPAAYTAEQRLQMTGRPVNPQTLSEELMHGANRANGYMHSQGFRNGASSFFRTLLKIIVFFMWLIAIIILGSLIVAAVIGIITVIAASMEMPQDDNLASFLQLQPMLFWYSLLAIVSGIVCLSILLYGSLRMMLKSRNTKPLPSATMVTLIIIAVLTATSAAVLGGMTAVSFKDAKREWREKNLTVNGVLMENDSRNKLDIEGWKVTQAVNCNEDGVYCYDCDDFCEDCDQTAYRFKKVDKSKPMSIAMERTENLPAGRYRIEAVTAVDGPGLEVFYGDSIMQVQSRDTQGLGNFARMSFAEAKATGMLPDTMTEQQWNESQREDVEKWSYQQQEFTHSGGTLTYGLRGTQRYGADKAKMIVLRVVRVADDGNIPDDRRAQNP